MVEEGEFIFESECGALPDNVVEILEVRLHVNGFLFIPFAEVLGFQVVLADEGAVEISNVVQEMQLVHEGVLGCLVMLVAPFYCQLGFPLSPHQPLFWFVSHHFNLDRLYQSEQKYSPGDLGMGPLLGN